MTDQNQPTMTMEQMYASPLWDAAQAARDAYHAAKDSPATTEAQLEALHAAYANSWAACWNAVGF